MDELYTAQTGRAPADKPYTCSVKILLERVELTKGYPCFLIAPRNCGQRELLEAYYANQESSLDTATHHGSLPNPTDQQGLFSDPPKRRESLLNSTKQQGSISNHPKHEEPLFNPDQQDTFPDFTVYDVTEEGVCVLADFDTRNNHFVRCKTSAHRHSGKKGRGVLIAYVPWLADDAAQRFSHSIDSFIEEGSEVFVCCPLQNDRYHTLQSDRTEISALELKQSGLFAPEEYGCCLKQFMTEFLPLHLRLVAAVAVFLGSVSLEELQELGYEVSPDVPRLLTELIPLFTLTHEGRRIHAEFVDMQQIKHEFFQMLSEYLVQRGQHASIALLASRVTALSIKLLERGDLETSHQVLSIAEELIGEGVLRETSLDTHDTSRASETDLCDVFRLSVKASHADDQHFKSSESRVLTNNGHTMYNASAGDIPILSLSLFGKMEVSINGKACANKHLTRAKIRRLLAYLAINQQRVVSRDSLLEYLWPYLDFDRAQKNLYTSWCMLAKGLGSEKVRDCPYIQRNGELYQLNSEYVVCDTQQFERIARSVLFGRAPLDIQIKSLLELRACYRDSLVADIPVDSFIAAKMTGYRSMMVDVLLLVTRQLRQEGELERALFCARSAYELDETREDVYRELMDTQLEAGQRTSAMQTYFSCKRYLSDELGILPSKSTTALYQDLLLDNCR